VVTEFLEQALQQIAPCYASFGRLNHGATLLWDRLVARVIEFLRARYLLVAAIDGRISDPGTAWTGLEASRCYFERRWIRV